ncbi:acidic leucine-rich nuclear phosphoprotein 32 family member B [Brachypodium distachyon]|uniref:acidic leucine-rich nuclear phosphoprotein 32 family member B n=1 Tax=Brachypodium distachyon TaxID=15368 RepID=UPI00071DD24C|nr:acidic leucine-rich nuclear phosphoprotein 32 family member B [Brachypodium distachyon]|eukprot:XP_014751202.1 acidic leucine-rich nuclear phosphoprotein 32 family member B [Brachypodium distachyon]
MDTVMEPAAPGALHACADDDLAELLTAAGAEDTICCAPEFKMGGKKSDEAAPTDAGDEDGDDDDGDDDGDFAEGEEEISEGEEYDNAKGNDNKKKQIGDGEENDGVEEEDDDQDNEDEEEDDDEDSLQPPKKRKK